MFLRVRFVFSHRGDSICCLAIFLVDDHARSQCHLKVSHSEPLDGLGRSTVCIRLDIIVNPNYCGRCLDGEIEKES
jgi:hypothetical protein